MPEEEVKEEVKKPIEEEQKQIEKEMVADPEDKIARANAAAARIEAANKVQEELLIREERLKVNSVLGGKSELVDKPSKADEEKAAARKLLPDDMHCPGVTD